MSVLTKSDVGFERHFQDTLSTIIECQAKSSIHRGIAVAFSGGLDSTVLLNLTVEFAKTKKIPIFAFHIHHGLSANADEWLGHCQLICQQLSVQFSSKKITVNHLKRDGVEAAARDARYQALGELCSDHQIPLVLTGHHQDDQAETLLLQLLRGSGLSGLSGMDLFNFAPKLLGTSDVLLARPLLIQSKQALLDYADTHEIDFIDDESNSDARFLRNGLRHLVMPVLSKISPGYASRLARSVLHLQSASQLLLELAKEDFDKYFIEDGLDIDLMRHLSDERIDNLLRFWLSKLGVRMPSTARLSEMRSQLLNARHDAKITISHDVIGVHRYKNKIYASSNKMNGCEIVKPVEFEWRGEKVIHFSEFHGSLFFETALSGVDSSWLKQQKLCLRMRQGGERLKLAENRPTRDIKSHFQSLNIPFWKRRLLPFLCINDDLLHAAGVGTQATYFSSHACDRINFRWQFDVP
jgi:tRNA(Ile)-lysidine synthase